MSVVKTLLTKIPNFELPKKSIEEKATEYLISMLKSRSNSVVNLIKSRKNMDKEKSEAMIVDEKVKMRE